MVTKEQIARINELFKKKTEVGLSEQETLEQAELRKLYIDSYKQSLKSQLDNIEVVDSKSQSTAADVNKNSHKHRHLHKHGSGCGCGCGTTNGKSHKH